MASFLACVDSCSAKEIETISPADFSERIQSDSAVVVIDLRRQSEFDSGHLKDAILIDFLNTENFDNEIQKLDKGKKYYVYCRSGRRSHLAAVKMQEIGLSVVDMAGGIIDWQKNNLPIVK